MTEQDGGVGEVASKVGEDSMDTIQPTQPQTESSPQNDVSEPASRESVGVEIKVPDNNEGDSDGGQYESDCDLQNNEDDDSTSSRASSTELGQKSRNATGRSSRQSNGRGGRSAHSVSFSRAKSRIVEKRVRYDGQEMTMVTLSTQTDWDWLECAQHSSKVKVLMPTEAEEPVMVSSARELTPSTSGPPPSLNSILVKPESREPTSRPRTELGISSAADSRAETDYTPFSLQPNDEYGIPLLEMSSTSDDSSDDESSKRKRAPRVSLPSVGPPQILKYIRESQMDEDFGKEEPLATSEVDDTDLPVDEDGNPLGMFAGPCEFCHQNILPLPTLEMQQTQDPDSLYCCEDYREFIQFATSTALRMEQEAHKATQMISVKVHPHHGSKYARKAAKERAVERMRQRELARRQQEAVGSQNNFYSSGASAGGQAKGIPPRPAQMSFKPATLGGGGGGGSMFKDMARQIKTINYQLSSQRCLEEGWTLRPPSPMEMDGKEVEVFIPEPLHPSMIASGNINDRNLIVKNYPNGDKFLTIFPDGTGNVYYPSGRLAVLISSVALGQFSYIVHDDCPDAPILANFDPSGFGSIYFLNGNVRLCYDQLGGMELDVQGGKKRRWSWKDQETHVHAPPFQPVCIRLNYHHSVRVMGQEAIALTFMASKRSCRFSVGARLKLVDPKLLPPPEIDEHQLYVNESTAKVETILSKVSALLKFPKSPKVDKILPPLHVTSKINRNEKMRKSMSSVRTSTENKKTKGRNAMPAVSVN